LLDAGDVGWPRWRSGMRCCGPAAHRPRARWRRRWRPSATTRGRHAALRVVEGSWSPAGAGGALFRAGGRGAAGGEAAAAGSSPSRLAQSPWWERPWRAPSARRSRSARRSGASRNRRGGRCRGWISSSTRWMRPWAAATCRTAGGRGRRRPPRSFGRVHAAGSSFLAEALGIETVGRALVVAVADAGVRPGAAAGGRRESRLDHQRRQRHPHLWPVAELS